MIDQATFELIKEKYGHCASWAIWADAGEKPKDNIGDLSIFGIEKRDRLLSQLKPDVVLVGLNCSRGSVPFTLGNLHDRRPQSQDYKLRYALKNTPIWGAYITDIIKEFDQKASGKVMAYLHANKSFETHNIDRFREELGDLNADKPTLIALGEAAFKVLTRNLGGQYRVLKLPHYAKYISKKQYREECRPIIESSGIQPNV